MSHQLNVSGTMSKRGFYNDKIKGKRDLVGPLSHTVSIHG